MPPASTRAPAIAVAVCFCIAALEGYDIQAFGVAAPAMAPALGLAKDQVGFAGSAAMLGLIVGAVFGGWLADRIGRKPVLVASTAWFGVFSLVTTLATGAETLTLFRLLTGLGFGGAMPNMVAMAVEISRPERRISTVSAMFVGFPAGGALVSLLTPFLTDWRAIFAVGGLLPLAVTPLALLLLPESRPIADTTARPDRRALAALFGGGRALTTLLLWLASILTLLIIYLLVNWLPTLVVGQGHSKAAGALAALSFNVVGVAGGLIAGRVADRFDFRWPLAAAYVGLAAATVGLALSRQVASMFIFSGLAGAFVLGAQYVLYALPPRYYAAAVRGAGAGAAVAAGRVGSIAGPAIAGLVLSAGASGGDVMRLLTPVALAAGAAAFGLSFVGRAIDEPEPGVARV